jgi:prepilin-type N-terminal cleavage/methylation domain-containing protein
MMKKGMSLIEVVLALAIVAILMVFMTISLNPAAMVGRANDAQRKKDIGKIKLAMEEHYNDKGCYPTQAVVDAIGCSSRDFNPWLEKWPCDPNGSQYVIGMENASCPSYYRILTNLENKHDSDIPSGWYESTLIAYYGDGLVDRDMVNYGVSSTNVKWYDQMLSPDCDTPWPQCYRLTTDGCTSWSGGPHTDAYVHHDCLPQCRVSCCLDGQVCN